MTVMSSENAITYILDLLLQHCTEVRFASLLSGGFITAIAVNPPEKKLANQTSVRFRAVKKRIQQVLRAYCPNIYCVPVYITSLRAGNLFWLFHLASTTKWVQRCFGFLN